MITFLFGTLIGWLPAILIRFVILKRPVSKLAAFGISAVVWFIYLALCNFLLEDVSKAFPTLGVSAIGSFSILILRRTRREAKMHPLAKAQKQTSKTDQDYVLCSSCSFEQWSGYSVCQNCGASFV